jgi:hypothetical protein
MCCKELYFAFELLHNKYLCEGIQAFKGCAGKHSDIPVLDHCLVEELRSKDIICY